jgi:hypothetical protein
MRLVFSRERIFMTAAEFETWLLDIKHKRAFRHDHQVAALLDVSMETIRNMRREGCDRRTDLACTALLWGLDAT